MKRLYKFHWFPLYKFIFGAFLSSSLFSVNIASASNNLIARPDIQQFINTMAVNYQFNHAQLESWFSRTQLDSTIIAKMEQPYEAKPWYVYRNSLVSQARINQGVKFWQQNADMLTAIEKQYGVPASVIIAIIGVETAYGTNKGSYPVMNALTTLAFAYPRRANFFRSELTQFLLLSREQNWDPLSIKGSYAGAMGYPQFMPSSYRKFAVDYDKNGRSDLINNHNDVIASIANYLKFAGWKANEPVAIPAKLINTSYQLTKQANGKPHYTVKQLRHWGVVPATRIAPTLPAGLLSLENRNANEYWLTFTNFAAITRYNSSPKYAMAVYQLSQAISQAYYQTAKQDKKSAYKLAAN